MSQNFFIITYHTALELTSHKLVWNFTSTEMTNKKLLITTITIFFFTTSLNAHSIYAPVKDRAIPTRETAEITATNPPCNCPNGNAPNSPKPSSFVNMKQYLAYFVIQAFKNTITCDPLNVTATWVGYRPCTYRGFYCEAPPDSPKTPTVASIDFNGFHLCAPTLEGFIDQFPDLALFHANSNKFGGSVPNLRGLRYLYELDLSNNVHTGPFPINVLPLSNLVFLDLRYNIFDGGIPRSVFNLDPEVLFLNNNNFNQSLPVTLGRSTTSYLTFANNKFTGPIPRTIGNLTNSLIEVLFLNNKLQGCLPYEIGKLSKSTVFDVGGNKLTGPIPWSFGCLVKVEQLNLADNLLYGEVPDVVCKLANTSNLENFTLSGNYFTNLGSSCYNLVQKKILDVSKNCIRGLPNQRTSQECDRFWQNNRNCPLVHMHYIPCTLPTGTTTSETAARIERTLREKSGTGAAPAPRYVGYKALYGRPGN